VASSADTVRDGGAQETLRDASKGLGVGSLLDGTPGGRSGRAGGQEQSDDAVLQE